MFNEKLTMQIALHYLNQQRQAMSRLKLMKLLYITEREFIKHYGCTLTNDGMYSYPQGPVLIHALAVLQNNRNNSSIWTQYTKCKDCWHQLVQSIEDEQASDLISPAVYKLLTKIWQTFGYMGPYRMRDYTHTMFSEWRYHKLSQIIKSADLFSAFGYTLKHSTRKAKLFHAHKIIANMMQKLEAKQNDVKELNNQPQPTMCTKSIHFLECSLMRMQLKNVHRHYPQFNFNIICLHCHNNPEYEQYILIPLLQIRHNTYHDPTVILGDKHESMLERLYYVNYQLAVCTTLQQMQHCATGKQLIWRRQLTTKEAHKVKTGFEISEHVSPRIKNIYRQTYRPQAYS